MRRLLVLPAVLLLLCSCTITQPRQAPVSDGELIHHPQLLLDSSYPPADLRLWGVKLGDPVSVIPPNRILQNGAQGWIWCRDGSRYRAVEGTVVTLGLWDLQAIDQLNITTAADVEARFGPTSTIDVAEPLRIYRYRDGKLAVIWNDRERRVNAINISR